MGTIGNLYQPTNSIQFDEYAISQGLTTEAAEKKEKKVQVGVDEVEWFYGGVSFEEFDSLKNGDEDQLLDSGLFKPMNGL